MKLTIFLETTKTENGLRIGDRLLTPDKEFASLPREKQVQVLQIIKNDLDEVIRKNNLITSRQAGLN